MRVLSSPQTSLASFWAALPFGVIALDGDGNIAFLNDAAIRLCGLSPVDVVHRHWTEALLRVAEPKVRGSVERALRNEVAEFFDEGSEAWLSVTAEAVDGGGQLLVFSDVTRVREAELKARASHARSRRLQALMQALVSKATPVEVCEEVLSALLGHLEADAGFVVGVSQPSGPLLLAQAGDVPRERVLGSLSHWSLSALSGDWMAVPEDGEAWTYLRLVSEGRALGFIALRQTAPREWLEGERAFADSVVALGAGALSRAELLVTESLARRRAESAASTLDTALENLPSGVALFETNSLRLVLSNARLGRMLGVDLNQLSAAELEKPLFMDIEGFPLPHSRSPVRRAIVHGESIRGEEVGYWNPDGVFSRLKVSTVVMPPTTPGRAGVVLAVFEDVTRQRRAEEHLRFLSESSSALTRSMERNDVAAELARVAVPQFADWCMVHLRDDAGVLTFATGAHRDEEKLGLLGALESQWSNAYRGEHGWPKVTRTGLPELFGVSEERVPFGAGGGFTTLLRDVGAQTVLSVPLTVEGTCIGALTFGSGEHGVTYTQQDLLVAMEVARRAAIALESNRLFVLAQSEGRRATEASRLKDEFLSTLSHELRTPLTSLLGWVQMLRAGSLPPEKHAKALETIERNARTQIRLVSDLLEVSGVVTGKVQLTLAPTELGPVLSHVIESSRPTAAAKGIDLVVKSDRGLWLMGDAPRLSQVLWNLLNNAVKFTPAGGRVEISAKETPGGVELSVRDTGEGIEPSFLPHVFERFRQAEGNSTRRHGGLGLGLAIVRHLVELHGGTVAVTSQGLGMGSTFSVFLPPMPERTAHLSEAEADASAYEAARHRIRGAKVLVVDDEPDACEVLAALLSAAGAHVSTAMNADEALERIRIDRPDIVLSDIGLPGDDGYRLMRRLRSMRPENGACTPAVALTAYAGAEARAKALHAGFNQHLAKPFAPDELEQVLTAVLADSPRVTQH